MNIFFIVFTSIINGHFEKMYHTSTTGRTVRGIKWSSTFFLVQGEVETGGGQFVVG